MVVVIYYPVGKIIKLSIRWNSINSNCCLWAPTTICSQLDGIIYYYIIQFNKMLRNERPNSSDTHKRLALKPRLLLEHTIKLIQYVHVLLGNRVNCCSQWKAWWKWLFLEIDRAFNVPGITTYWLGVVAKELSEKYDFYYNCWWKCNKSNEGWHLGLSMATENTSKITSKLIDGVTHIDWMLGSLSVTKTNIC